MTRRLFDPIPSVKARSLSNLAADTHDLTWERRAWLWLPVAEGLGLVAVQRVA